ncbi:MAG TPA: cytochrome c oxidase subunit 3 family protein [Terriglobales bacterium]|nr:cytochrome c oxidase subunit 3 family protein [Terriglobales bacterium]
MSDNAHTSPAVATHPALQHHFDDMEQQREASSLGMWVFLMTEVMFFGGLFLGYLVYRTSYPGAFAAGSMTLNVTLGAINTAVLIGSSFTMAMAVWSAQMGKRGLLMMFLVLTMVLGTAFLGIKAVEYHEKWETHHVPGKYFQFHEKVPGTDVPADPRNAQIFFFLYFGMTGMHALHMIIGMGIMTYLLITAYQGKYGPDYHTPVENGGLYWHFVDIVWIFLFPLLYLIAHRGGH